MMRAFAALFLVAGLLPGLTASAADDPGLMLHDAFPGGRQVGLGVGLSASIPLGGAQRPAARPQPRLSLRAGPSVTRIAPPSAPRARTTIAPLTEVSLRPGYSITWSLAGHPLAASYTHRALRDLGDAGPDRQRSNISTLGTVAIGLGVVAVVGAVLLVDRLDQLSDEARER